MMSTEDMIRELGIVKEDYENKSPRAALTNIPVMLSDVIRKLEELNKEIESLKMENAFLRDMFKGSREMLKSNSEYSELSNGYKTNDLVNRDPKDPIINNFPNSQPGSPEPILL